MTTARTPNYLVAVVSLAVVAIVAVAVVYVLRPERDNAILVASIFGFASTTLMSLLSYLKAQETHLSVNSRLDAFVTTAETNARQAGNAAGRVEGAAAANERTDALNK